MVICYYLPKVHSGFRERKWVQWEISPLWKSSSTCPWQGLFSLSSKHWWKLTETKAELSLQLLVLLMRQSMWTDTLLPTILWAVSCLLAFSFLNELELSTLPSWVNLECGLGDFMLVQIRHWDSQIIVHLYFQHCQISTEVWELKDVHLPRGLAVLL